MSKNEQVQFIVRNMHETDRDEVHQMLTIIQFSTPGKYDSDLILEINPKGVFVAQDLAGNTPSLTFFHNLSNFNLSQYLFTRQTIRDLLGTQNFIRPCLCWHVRCTA